MKARVFALVFIVAGLALAFVMARQILESLAPYGWDQSQCLIQKSEVVYAPEKQPACSHSLAYQYEVAGVKKTGSAWRLDPGVPDELCSESASLAGEFPANATVSCHVDPKNPARAVLDRGDLLSILKLLFPVGLILIGIALFRRKAPVFPPSLAAVKRIAQVVAACTVVACAIGTVFLGVMPLTESYESRTWGKAQCEVLASYLRTTRTGSAPGTSTKNPGYYINIVYRYDVNGQRHLSDRYDFSSFGSGRSDNLDDVIAAHPAGAKVACAVNPANPYEAVLVPGPLARYLWGFLPLLGVLIGSGLWVAVRRFK